MCLFILVCLQMTTALRTMLGTSDTFLPREKKFFVAHWLHTVRDNDSAKPARNPL